MRDPERIDKVLAAIGEVWYKYPDLRLGQLILNVVQDPTLYYIEDEDLVKRIDKFYGEISKGVASLKEIRDKQPSFKMRNATPEEYKIINDYIKSISRDTGINMWSLYDE